MNMIKLFNKIQIGLVWVLLKIICKALKVVDLNKYKMRIHSYSNKILLEDKELVCTLMQLI